MSDSRSKDSKATDTKTPDSKNPEMKTIVLLRHAKSAWGLDVDDHERPLSGRGRRDSLAVGALMDKRHLEPDLVYCSTATRAQQTWHRAVKGGAKAADVHYEERIYEAFVPELIKVIRKTSEDVSTLMLVGHAPGIPDLVDKLAVRKGDKATWARLDDKFPTSGMAVLSYAGSWADLSRDSATLVDFEVPRGKKK